MVTTGLQAWYCKQAIANKFLYHCNKELGNTVVAAMSSLLLSVLIPLVVLHSFLLDDHLLIISMDLCNIAIIIFIPESTLLQASVGHSNWECSFPSEYYENSVRAGGLLSLFIIKLYNFEYCIKHIQKVWFKKSNKYFVEKFFYLPFAIRFPKSPVYQQATTAIIMHRNNNQNHCFVTWQFANGFAIENPNFFA